MILAMKLWMAVVLLNRVTVGTATGNPTNHNDNEHGALCNVLSSAVTIFESGRGGPAFQKALRKAIFGRETGNGSIQHLMGSLPQEFHAPGNRQNWCGMCSDEHHYPGKSIPHDLLCLCTVGGGGYPFYRYSEGKTTLCGRNARELGCRAGSEHECSEGEGWNADLHAGTAPGHVRATWDAVVRVCLKRGGKLDFEEARTTLTGQLKIDKDRSPSWAMGHTYCGGNLQNGGICVNYPDWCKTGGFPQWLEDLQAALDKADFSEAGPMPPGTPTPTTAPTADNAQGSRKLNEIGETRKTTAQAESETTQKHATDANPISHPSQKEDRSTIILPIGLLWAALMN